ncbi:MAG: branched-chain amino acid aminotransferase [Actinomycetota bacterium]|nr:branched-chain amino acid aminotransferase [Actinomycetota bacterium]
MKVWLDGALVDEDQARVSAFDHALLTGDGVFETLRVYRGVPFASRRHLERLATSAAALRLPCPAPELVREAMGAVIAANKLEQGRMRITLTGGPSPLGSDRGDGVPTLIVAVGGVPAWPPTTDVVVVPWPRNERGALTGVKTVSYGENVVALAYARDRGAGEAVFANLVGNLCEGTGTNVFVGVGGRLLTPPLSAGCLAGVTRDLLAEQVDVVEEDLPVGRLAAVDEAFVTSSTREVQPIRAVDGTVLPAAPGPLTRAAAVAFTALVKRDLDP